MTSSEWSQRIRASIGRRRSVAKGALVWVEAVAAIATVALLAIGAYHHFADSGEAVLPGEGKRIVAFRQVVNRVCTENRQNLHRALAEPAPRIERLGFVARAVGWDVNDLEGVTAPPTRFDTFVEEVAVRRRVRPTVLALQGAIESGDQARRAQAIAELDSLEAESRELSRESGVARCTRILPPIRDLIRH